MNELAEKAREGALSSGEDRELENYRHVGHLLALLRSKARISLNATGHHLVTSRRMIVVSV